MRRMTLATRPVSILPAGTAFSRFAMALGLSKGYPEQAHALAERWRDTPHVAEVFRLSKAAVPGATAGHATWAGPLAAAGVSQEALTWLRGASIVGQLESKMRKVPFNVRVGRQTSSGTAGSRVAEGQAVAAVSFAFDSILLAPEKIQTLIVAENTLLRPEIPGAERTLRETISGNLAATIDRLFLDPAEAGSITNGITATPSTGATAALMTTDFGNLLAGITTAGTALVWIMRPTTAARVALTLGASTDLPRSLFGLPVVLSANSPAQITLLDAAEIAFADDGELDLELSRSSAIAMDSAPTNASSPAPVPTTLVSMFQTDSTAFLASRWIAWERLQAGAVAYMPVTSLRAGHHDTQRRTAPARRHGTHRQEIRRGTNCRSGAPAAGADQGIAVAAVEVHGLVSRRREIPARGPSNVRRFFVALRVTDDVAPRPRQRRRVDAGRETWRRWPRRPRCGEGRRLMDEDADWVRIDLHDPDCLHGIEAQARAAARDARDQAEDIARAQGCTPVQIAQTGAEVEQVVLDTWRENIAAILRRITH